MRKIKEMKQLNLKILKELMLNKETTILYLKKLKGYKYVDEINDYYVIYQY